MEYSISYRIPQDQRHSIRQGKLGHRSIISTLIYTHRVSYEGDEYHTTTSKSLKEDEELLKVGFEYVTERDGIKIYRKLK